MVLATFSRSKRDPEQAKSDPRAAKSRPDKSEPSADKHAPRGAQDVPQTLQEDPRRPQEDPRRLQIAQEAPKCPQETPKRFLRGRHGAPEHNFVWGNMIFHAHRCFLVLWRRRRSRRPQDAPRRLRDAPIYGVTLVHRAHRHLSKLSLWVGDDAAQKCHRILRAAALAEGLYNSHAPPPEHERGARSAPPPYPGCCHGHGSFCVILP